MTPSPFPGMDPYLEARTIWPDLHNSLMLYFRQQLSPQLAPKYTVELETELVIDQILPDESDKIIRLGYADVSVIEPTVEATLSRPVIDIAPAPFQLLVPIETETRLVSLHIRHRASDQIVTVIEMLSPVNKRQGKGRRKYIAKRNDYFSSNVHLVELDLLRAYPRLPYGGKLPDWLAYLITISVSTRRPTCDAWPLRLSDPLPTIPIPLRRPDPPVPLALQTALQTAYEEARYDLRIDYSQSPPPPPLTESQQAWLDDLF